MKEGVPASPTPSSRSPARAVDPDVRAYLDWVRVECGAADNTLKAYRADLARYLDHVPARRVRQATAEHVLAFLAAEQERGMSPSTRARRLVAVRCLHRWLASEKRMLDDPAARIEGPELWDRLPHCLGLDDVDRLLESPDDRGPGRPARPSCHGGALRVRPTSVGGRGAAHPGRAASTSRSSAPRAKAARIASCRSAVAPQPRCMTGWTTDVRCWPGP